MYVFYDILENKIIIFTLCSVSSARDSLPIQLFIALEKETGVVFQNCSSTHEFDIFTSFFKQHKDYLFLGDL